MKTTLAATAFALTLALGGIAVQSAASAHPAAPNPALMGTGGLVTTVAAKAHQPAENKLAPQTQQEPQEYPKYHDQATDAYYSPPLKANPCRFTQAPIDGVMKQVEVCD
ncbi:hypothetical protein AB4Z10_19245 [Bosea sp. RAF48]|uniref:hypothetical protein n=1 Tax=Bosea sp. RAF48 TaxID=3237480 RepID=UPI003F916B3A